MALSVLVFTAARTDRRWLYPAAVLIHTVVCGGKKCGSAEKSPPYSQGDVIYWG